MKQCKVCKIEIPKERLEVLPHTETCVKHSTEQAYVGVMDFPHKTGSSLVKVKPSSDPEAYRRMMRAYHRSR
jgi:hypothetical protein